MHEDESDMMQNNIRYPQQYFMSLWQSMTKTRPDERKPPASAWPHGCQCSRLPGSSLLSKDRGGSTRRLWERLGDPGGGLGVASSMSSSEDTSPPMRRRSPMEIGPSLITSRSWPCRSMPAEIK